MVRGFPFAQYKWLLIPAGFLILVAGLSGCALIPTLNSSSLAPTPATVCTPESTTVNIYRTPPQSWANLIFKDAFPPIPPPIPPAQTPSDARYSAFQLLVNETQRWSDIETIKFNDDLSEAHIIITFISPELLQAVFLNDVLRDGSVSMISDFEIKTQNMLNAVAERDELLFLLTVTMTMTNNSTKPDTIKIPIEKMILTNAGNLELSPSHDDHNLAQLIDTSSGPVFGYLAYPLAILSGTQCKWILEPRYNTNIVITLPSIEIDGVANNIPHSWTIPYASLINPITSSSITPVPTLSPTPDPILMGPLPLPPKEPNDANYWHNFAKFIWNQITLGNY